MKLMASIVASKALLGLVWLCMFVMEKARDAGLRMADVVDEILEWGAT